VGYVLVIFSFSCVFCLFFLFLIFCGVRIGHSQENEKMTNTYPTKKRNRKNTQKTQENEKKTNT
jgi:hypothetical protein